MCLKSKNIQTPDELLSLLKKMLRIRYFESAAKDSVLNGKIPGACHVYIGEEAVAVGVCNLLNKDDYVISTHRGHGHCLAKGADPKLLMAELFGRSDGYCQGRGGSMHIFIKELGVLGTNGIVGGGLPLALGAGMHAKLNKTGQVAVCFFGDGAANQGTFHESINLAAIQRLPVIFVCENNLYATATKMTEVTLTKQFADRAQAYGIPGKTLDGNNVISIGKEANEAVCRAREGKGPSFLECLTYRHLGHYVGENTDYRPKEEVEMWLQKDPIVMLKKYLVDNGLIKNEVISQLECEMKNQIDAAVVFASESPYPEISDVNRHVFVNEVI
ncbi:MAG: pyruvate dehydrogenase (acetyl-transferring) E1 component subunit alpha [Planctomycetes bacterium GWF2_42_9]|nr:MAG: pyruvate dehydrogenase (acetyl-transferring) E1 component subunit alpha [Planctomycetes bacterium GWF2_42_9]